MWETVLVGVCTFAMGVLTNNALVSARIKAVEVEVVSIKERLTRAGV